MPLLLLLAISSCSGTKSGNVHHLSKLDASEIETAEIKKALHDTVSVQLTTQQISKLVAVVSDSPGELLKAFPKYCIFVKLKNDSIIPYKVIDHYIGENDAYVKTREAVYFREVYENSKKTKHLISLKTLH